MKNVIVLGMLVVLAGCVVVPRPYHRSEAPIVEPVVVYPQNVDAYVWDAALLTYFFIYQGHRYHMPQGWHHRQGVPRGHHPGNRHSYNR